MIALAVHSLLMMVFAMWFGESARKRNDDEVVSIAFGVFLCGISGMIASAFGVVWRVVLP